TAVKTAALAALILLGLTIGRDPAAVAANFGAHFWPGGGLPSRLFPVFGTAALQAMLGAPGLYLMAIAIMISTFGCNNGLILSGARVYYAMARDDLFFRSAGVLHPRYRTPAVALVVQAVWTSVLCLSGTYSQLLDFVIFAALVFYMLTAAGLFALRLKRPAAQRPVRVPGYPWLPACYLALTGAIAAALLAVKPTY